MITNSCRSNPDRRGRLPIGQLGGIDLPMVKSTIGACVFHFDENGIRHLGMVNGYHLLRKNRWYSNDRAIILPIHNWVQAL